LSFPKLPRHTLKICLSGCAIMALAAITLTVSTLLTSATPTTAAKAVSPMQSQAHGVCQVSIDGHVPYTLPIITSDYCENFVLSVKRQDYPTKITVCPQTQKPPLWLGDDYHYDTRHCVSWVARNKAPHNIFRSPNHPLYPGYIIRFATTQPDQEAYPIRAEIQQ
jgi:hypothetical protein